MEVTCPSPPHAIVGLKLCKEKHGVDDVRMKFSCVDILNTLSHHGKFEYIENNSANDYLLQEGKYGAYFSMI